MRTAFINELVAQARIHPEIFLVVGDIGFSVVESFAREFPERFLNAGVAEQNMTGVAAGLASEGYHVFTYSIANFPTLRCLEQIRNDICYHELPVTVVAVGAGVAYGNLGYSHHALQDIAIMRTLQPIRVLSPADPGETRECVRSLAADPFPSYLRLGKAGEAELHEVRGITDQPLQIADGTCSAAIVATGAVLKIALETAKLAGQRGMSIAVFSCPWLHPVTTQSFQALQKYRRLIVLEEHISSGGLASILREHLATPMQITSYSLTPDLVFRVGSQSYLWNIAGLVPETILETLFQSPRHNSSVIS